MIMTNENIFWKKKEIVSFILSILVFFVHISSFAQYSNTGNLISTINEKASFFFKESITSFAVPMFYILSGISFYKNYDNSKYLNKIKSRVFTIIIPYLLWNTIWMIFDIICSYSFLSKYFVGREQFAVTFTNVLKGIFLYECNEPFWFIYKLIIFSLAAPLIYTVIRNKYIGIASIGILTVFVIVGKRLFPSTFSFPTSIMVYLVGAIIGKHYFDYTLKKSSKVVQCLSIVVLFTYIILKNLFAPQIRSLESFLPIVTYTILVFALWSILDLFIDKMKTKKVYSRSFAIYAMHVNISAIITKLVFIVFPKREWMAIPNFFATVILTLLFIHLVCSIGERFFPRVYSILMGERVR